MTHRALTKLRRFRTVGVRGSGDLVLRRVIVATALAAIAALPAVGCGGTLEGKYRRGELTTTTTRGAPATTPTSGNAAGQRVQGEPERPDSGGTIVLSAIRRSVVSPLGGRHR